MFGAIVIWKVHIFEHQTHTLTWSSNLWNVSPPNQTENPSLHLPFVWAKLPDPNPSIELDLGKLCAPMKQLNCVPLFYCIYSSFLCIVIWIVWALSLIFNDHLYFFCGTPISILLPFFLLDYLFLNWKSSLYIMNITFLLYKL